MVCLPSPAYLADGVEGGLQAKPGQAAGGEEQDEEDVENDHGHSGKEHDRLMQDLSEEMSNAFD